MKALSRSTLLRHLTVALVAVVVIMLATGTLDTFYDYQLAVVAAYLCAVAGLTVLTGLNGQVSLGQSALMAVGAYTVAKSQTYFSDHNVTTQWTLLYSLAIAVLVAAIAGLVIGLAAARLRGPYLAGLTLAIVIAVPAVTTRWSGFFGADQGLSVPMNPPPAFLGEGFPNEQWQAYFAVIAAAITMFALANLARSRYGRNFRAVRDNEAAASLAGIHVARTQVIAFVVSAACAGLGGGVFAAVNQAVSPDTYSLTLSLYLLLAIVLGGVGSLVGAVWGSVAIVALPYLTSKAMDSVSLAPAEATRLQNNVPLALFGLVLIVIAIAVPGGVQGLLRRLGFASRQRFGSGRLRRGEAQPRGTTVNAPSQADGPASASGSAAAVDSGAAASRESGLESGAAAAEPPTIGMDATTGLDTESSGVEPASNP